MKKINLILLLLFFSCSTKPPITSIDIKGIYVSPKGNDQSLGTFNDPYQSIHKALSIAIPGNTVYLREGEYHEKIEIKKSGTAKLPITITSYTGEQAVIDGEKFKVEDKSLINNQYLIRFENVSHIKISNLLIKNLESTKINTLIAAIMVLGHGEDITISNNEITEIKTLVNSPGGDAHGIAIYGSDPKKSLRNINISNNKLHHLKLGSSEALVVNGNVEEFEIKNNTIFEVDNIAIDAIGFEGKSSNRKNDQARRGLIEGNIIYDVSSYGNPAYGKEYSAGGIYVDGGKKILIKNNKIFRSDIGIELASEHKNRATSNITVVGNVLAFNRLAGLAMGGYDLERGQTQNCIISENIFYKNDSLKGGNGEIYFQYYNFNNTISKNKIESNEQALMIGNRDKDFNRGNKFDSNQYFSEVGANKLKFLWKNEGILGLDEFKKRSGQERLSSFALEALPSPEL